MPARIKLFTLAGMTGPNALPTSARAMRAWRGGSLLVVSLALHGLLLSGKPPLLYGSTLADTADMPVSVTLRPVAAPIDAVPLEQKPAVPVAMAAPDMPSRKSLPVAKRQTPPNDAALDQNSQTTGPTGVVEELAPDQDALNASGPGQDATGSALAADPKDDLASVTDPPADAGNSDRDALPRLALPPPAELRYDVEAVIRGQRTHGCGRITWQQSGNAYAIRGEAGVLFFNVLEFGSEGSFDERGIAPELYREKRFRKPVTNTYFDRESNLISFSTSEGTAPRHGGEQDRASIIWQLAAIGRGDPDAFHSGVLLAVTVAAVRKFETWQLRVIGSEHIQVGMGVVRAWHVAREPVAGTDDQRIDFWFAPEHEWYPVKIRYGDANGDWLDLSLSAIAPIAAPPSTITGY